MAEDPQQSKATPADENYQPKVAAVVSPKEANSGDRKAYRHVCRAVMAQDHHVPGCATSSLPQGRHSPTVHLQFSNLSLRFRCPWRTLQAEYGVTLRTITRHYALQRLMLIYWSPLRTA
jgi:hypothetical protein